MNNIPLPSNKESQIARKKIIGAARAFQEGYIDYTELLYTLFCEYKNDPVLESRFGDKALGFINNFENNLSCINGLKHFAQELANLPLIDEEANPYYFCSNPNECIDRQIVLKLNKAFPELLQDELHVSFLELPTCAHLCYSNFAEKLNQVVDSMLDAKGNISSKILQKPFDFIEEILSLEEPYATNVIAVSFLEKLNDKTKAECNKLLKPRTRKLNKNLTEYLGSLFAS